MPFCEPETTTSRPQASVSIGSAPRLETASIASRHERPRVSSPIRLDVRDGRGRGLGVHDDGELQRLVGHRRGDGLGIGRPPPLAFEHRHVRAERARHRDPAVAERAGGDAEDAIARLDEVREHRLERAGAGGREEQDVVLGAEDELELAQHLAVGRDEARAAVVLLRRAHDGQHLGRHRHRAGREQERVVSHGRAPHAAAPGRSCGSARPPVAFMTWPTKKPIRASLPARNCSACSGCAGDDLGHDRRERVGVGDLRRARAPRRSLPGRPRRRPRPSPRTPAWRRTSRACRRHERRPAPRAPPAGTGDSAGVTRASLRCAENSLSTQLAAARGSPEARRDLLEVVREPAADAEVERLRERAARRRARSAARARRAARAARAQLARSAPRRARSARGRARGSSGSRAPPPSCAARSARPRAGS